MLVHDYLIELNDMPLVESLGILNDLMVHMCDVTSRKKCKRERGQSLLDISGYFRRILGSAFFWEQVKPCC